MHTFSTDNLNKLLAALADDDDATDLAYDLLRSFSEYHGAIYESELCLKRRGVCEEYFELDKRRTICHNAVLTAVTILNRLAKERSIPLSYDGEVSESQPYRREVADAVLGFVESLILARR